MKRRTFIKTAAGAGVLAASRGAVGQTTKGRLRVAVIGRTGRGDYGHGLDVIWKEIEQAEIVAVADEDAGGRAEAAKRLGVGHAYADYREMLEKERPQIVSVAPRWLDCHRDMVLACAEHGCHVYLEKPLCRTLAEADEMVAAMERRQLKLVIAHTARYSPAIERLQEMIAADKLGDLLELRGRGKEEQSRGGGEDLMVLGTHIMDLIRLLAGDPQWCFAEVRADGRPITKEQVRDGNEGIGPLAGDEIQAVYRLPKRGMGYFSTLRARHGAGSRYGLQVYTTTGVLTINPDGPRVWYVEDPSWSPGASRAEWQPLTAGGLGRPEPGDAVTDPRLGHRLAALDLIRSIEKDTQPKGNIHDGRAALEMILATYESHRLHQPVPLPLKNREHPLSLM